MQHIRMGTLPRPLKVTRSHIASSQPDSRKRLGQRIGMGVAPSKETPGQVRVERRPQARKPVRAELSGLGSHTGVRGGQKS